MQLLSTLCGTAVTISSGYAIYATPIDANPYAIAAYALCCCYGAFCMYNGITDNDEGGSKPDCPISMAIKMIPLNLINIQLYLASDTNAIGLGHGLFIVPFALCFALDNFEPMGGGGGSEEGAAAPPADDGGAKGGDSKSALKELVMFGSLWSLFNITFNDNKDILMAMSAAGVLYHLGPLAGEQYFEHGENTMRIGLSILLALTPFALAK